MPGYSGGHRQNHRSMTDDDPLPPGKRVSSLDRATTSGVAGLRSPNASSTTRGTPDGPRSLSAERAGSSFRDSRIRGNGGSGHLSGLHVKSSPVSSVGDYSPTGKVTPQGKLYNMQMIHFLKVYRHSLDHPSDSNIFFSSRYINWGQAIAIRCGSSQRR